MNEIEIFCGECKFYREKFDHCKVYTTDIIKTHKGFETVYNYLYPRVDNRHNDCKYFKQKENYKIVKTIKKFISFNRKLYV